MVPWGKILVAALAIGLFVLERSPMGRSLKFLNLLRTPGFSEKLMPNMSGKICIVTGGSSGLGRASVAVLHKYNAHVIMAVRDVSKGEAVKASIIREASSAGTTTTGQIDVMHLELASLKSVRTFAEEFKKKYKALDVLMLNAGVFGIPFELTEDGIESVFAVSHVAHQALTGELLDLLKASAPSRIVTVSSGEHRNAPAHGVGVTLEQVNNRTGYDAFTAYGHAKLANILFTKELAKRLQGSGVYANVVHPGLTQTNVALPALVNNVVPKFMFDLITWLSYTPEEAVWTQMFFAASPEVEAKQISGEYYVPIAVPMREFQHPKATDAKLQEQLWNFTEKLIAQSKKGK